MTSPAAPKQLTTPCMGSAKAGSSAPTTQMAIQISGCTGKFSLVNDTYELMQMRHQEKPVWCARSTTPIYLFHTGKSRWVISKRIDDGARCYAFVSDEGGAEPDRCTGPWMSCGIDGKWSQDPAIKCEVVQASTDKFVQLRLRVEEEMKEYGLMDVASLKQLWRRLDANGNNVVSLAEVDNLIVDMCKSGVWPEWVNNKQAVMRAYQKTLQLDGDRDDWVEKEEFHQLLLNIFWFANVHLIFSSVDTNHDETIDLAEFKAGMSQIGLAMDEQEVLKEFRSVDTDGSGKILFVEFCAYVRQRVHPDHNPSFDSDLVTAEKHAEALRKTRHGDKATHAHYISKKALQDFNNTEKRVQDLVKNKQQLKKLWDRVDYNNNGVVSLAEFDKLVVEYFPVMNHKPALMRAFQATLRGDGRGAGAGGDFVTKASFTRLLTNLFYFNKLFWLFDQVDESRDRKLNIKEFKWCLTVCGLKYSDAKIEAEFRKVDTNKGGEILFDEFCRYFTEKTCPDALADWIEVGKGS